MKNKFLDKYPQLREPQVGDRIIFTTTSKWWDEGEKATIIQIDNNFPPEYYTKIEERYLFHWLCRHDFKVIYR